MSSRARFFLLHNSYNILSVLPQLNRRVNSENGEWSGGESMNELFGKVIQLTAVNLVLVALASSVIAGSRTLSATLTGHAEIPGPGDPDGTGIAKVTLLPGQGKVCFTVETQNIMLPALSAHIHGGEESVAGPVDVPLIAPRSDGKSEGCVSGVDEGLVNAIRENPQFYYVNVHTAEYPAGAIRGQLTK